MRSLLLLLVALGCTVPAACAAGKPNIVFILTDDQRWDALGCSGNKLIRTPHMDSLARRGTHFQNAFVTLSICSPSRAVCLTGRYGSSNGVTTVGKSPLAAGERTFAHYLKLAGYRTGVVGKWHLGSSPVQCGFDFATVCFANGNWYERPFERGDERLIVKKFVDDFVAEESARFIGETIEQGKPFALWMCTQVPHMDHRNQWPAREELLKKYDAARMPLPRTWNDDLAGKPAYLKECRHRTKALSYGYARPEAIRGHTRDYYAAIEQVDASIGQLLRSLDRLGVAENTWIVFMGDNGWMLGEHGFTSKVLPYEESIRVPMIIAGPGTQTRKEKQLVLNIDLMATILDIAGITVPERVHGRSLLPLVKSENVRDWREDFLYEAPSPQLGSKPIWGIRTSCWKYIETHTGDPTQPAFAELYDLKSDPCEKRNLASHKDHAPTVQKLAARLAELKKQVAGKASTSTTSP